MVVLGIDFGTSGARAVAIDATGKILAEAKHIFTKAELATAPAQLQTGLFCLLEQLPSELRQKIEAIAIDGTSSTVLLCDATGNPIVAPLLYNDDRGIAVMDELSAIAPPQLPSQTPHISRHLYLDPIGVQLGNDDFNCQLLNPCHCIDR